MGKGQELPFLDISEIPSELTTTNALLRMLEGLAFRYRWATENLIEENIKFMSQKIDKYKNTVKEYEKIFEKLDENWRQLT